jgi:hypothetical protein
MNIQKCYGHKTFKITHKDEGGCTLQTCPSEVLADSSTVCQRSSTSAVVADGALALLRFWAGLFTALDGQAVLDVEPETAAGVRLEDPVPMFE